MNERIITTAIWIISMTLIFWLFSKYFPINKSKYQTSKSVSELRKQFWKFDILILLLFFALTIIFVVLSYKFFGWISDMRFANFKNNGFLFLPQRMMWFVPAIFTGLGISALIFIRLQKPLLKERFDEYVAYSNLKYGFNADKASNILIRLLLIFVTGFFILAINNYAHFGNDNILISDFFQLTDSKYSYEDITDVKSVDKLIAPNGNIVVDKHFVINFTDSNKWSSRHGGDSDYEKDVEMINYILTKTGLELKHLEFDR